MPRIVGMELRTLALQAFAANDPEEKCALVQALWQRRSDCALDVSLALPEPAHPGRPDRPMLVAPKDVPHRSPFTVAGHAALIHSIAHIEFNAINLALDAVWRFPDLPTAFYENWLQVAWDEVRHFRMLRAHLQRHGFNYGDFPAHEGLWNMCEATRHDVASRMALVPRTLEARGLDATPVIQAKLRKVGTPAALEAVSLLDVILREEESHVAFGNHWYHWLCEQRGLDPMAFSQDAAKRLGAPRPKPPYNLAARARAGFTEAELQWLVAAP